MCIRDRPWDAGDKLPYWAWSGFSGHHLWDRVEDPGEERDLAVETAGRAAEKHAAEKLREALLGLDAPADQYVRLGLA